MDCRIVNPTNFTGTMLLVNGGGAIQQPMTAGAWLRLRLVNALTMSGGAVNLGFVPGGDGGGGGGSSGGGSGGGGGGGGGSGGGGGGGGGSGGGGDGVAACSLSVLAYDGVWLTAPRTQASVLLPPGGRAEVLIGCARGGVFAFGSLGSSDYGGVLTQGTVAVL